MLNRHHHEKISLLVPFRADVPERWRNWAWLRQYWENELPEAEVIMGRDDATPFCKTRAVNDAFEMSRGDILVILDADCYISGKSILESARKIREARYELRKTWFIPYRRFYRLTESASVELLGSDPADPVRFSDPPQPDQFEGQPASASFGHWFGALIQVMPRQAFDDVDGMDERFCVDEETQILTRSGWKSRTELREGEQVLTLDHEMGLSEWQPVLAVNSFGGEHEMISIESKTHSSLTTLNHRWPVVHRPDYRPGTGWGSRKAQRTWTTTGDIKDSDNVPTAAPCSDLPVEAKYTDALVEAVAWCWTEGSITRLRGNRPGRGVTISQSFVVNPANCDRIRACLASAFGPSSAFPRRGKSIVPDIPRWYEREDRRNVLFVFNAEAGEILQHQAPGRVPTHEFLLALTRAQLEVFISASILADGSERTGGEYEISLAQKNPAAAEAFQFACILAGHATSIRTAPVMERYGYGMTTVRIRQQREFRLVKGTHRALTLTGTVWCPTTPNGTWLARRNGTVYWTGNSGWGGEDISMMHAVDTLWGKHRLIDGPVYHIAHPVIKGDWMATRQWEGQVKPEMNDALSGRYEYANGDKKLMRRLIAGGSVYED